jgi:ribonucleoside-diphosphate reductase alpha chain
MEILVDNAGYPTEKIAKNSHDYRPLGLGYANLGALLMAFGLPYDSDAGRDFAATLTAIMCGEAYWQSARIAEPASPRRRHALTASVDRTGGACPGFYVNREPFLDVIRMHRAEVNNIGKPTAPVGAHSADQEPFAVPQLDDSSPPAATLGPGLAHGEKHGYRNSQVTVLAPTGTIGFMMDCDTTGIEPDLALVKYKKLVGGGMIKIVNNTVPSALIKLGYNEAQVDAIVSYIDATGTIEGAPSLKPEHLAVFDCSFKPAKGTRSIHYMGHIKMMAATQPFLSGAISKTVNLPQDCSVDDIAEAYIESWRLGLKAVAIYRDNSKGAQPLNVSDGPTPRTSGPSAELRRSRSHPHRDGLRPQTREADLKALEAKVAEKVEIASKSILGATTAFTGLARRRACGSCADLDSISRPRRAPSAIACPTSAPRSPTNSPSPATKATSPSASTPTAQPGEIFIRMAKEGSTVSGLMDSFATAISLALQHGVPLKVLCEKFAHTRFEPSGWTGNRDRLRQIHHGLHLPLDPAPLPLRPAAHAPTPCAACTTWATPPAATPAEPSWSATEAATDNMHVLRRCIPGTKSNGVWLEKSSVRRKDGNSNTL